MLLILIIVGNLLIKEYFFYLSVIFAIVVLLLPNGFLAQKFTTPTVVGIGNSQHQHQPPTTPVLSKDAHLRLAMSPYQPLILRLGNGMVEFLKCMGLRWIENCVRPTLFCALYPNPVICIELIICQGKNAFYCSRKYLHHNPSNNTTLITNITTT